MKMLFFGFLFLTMTAHAQVLKQIITHDVSGGTYNKRGEIDAYVTECTYTVRVDFDYPDQIAIFVNSDKTSYVNFSIRVPKNMLPLKNGTRFESIYGASISYSKGILRSSQVENDFPISRDKETLEIKVSPDLMVPKSAEGLNLLRDLTRSMKFNEINCKF